MNLQAALQAFLLQLEANGRSPHTIGQYRRHGTALANWLSATGASADVADLTPETIARFFADDAARKSCRGGPKKAVSLNAMRTSIRCFCAYLHDAGHVASNPARLLRRARCSPPPPRGLRDDEQKRLIAVLADGSGPEAERDRMLVDLLLGTGIRIGSAIALDVEDVDLDHSELSLRTAKNDARATAVMPADVTEQLAHFIGDRRTGALFLAGGQRVSVRHAQRRIAGWLQGAKIRGRSAHSMRHAFALRVYATTGDLLTTQLALGHASVISTCVYARADKSRLRAAVGA